MLPYSPLHHLLLDRRRHDARDDERQRLRRADRLSRRGRGRAARRDRRPVPLHDRPIETRTDDSVVRVVRGAPADAAGARAATCRTPLPLPLDCGRAPARLRRRAEEHVRAREGTQRLGGPPRGRPQELRDAALVRGRHRPLRAAVRGRAGGGRARPASRSTCRRSTRTSARAWGRSAVQHHHAHLAACLAEHGESGPAVGAIFDGTGYGADGTVWGGELLFGGLAGFERVGLLFPVGCPGGDAAIRQPWRMACAWLAASARRAARAAADPARDGRPDGVAAGRRAVAHRGRLAAHHERGRLFDAVAALCGIRAEVNYEGQAAIELEASARPARGRVVPAARCSTRATPRW